MEKTLEGFLQFCEDNTGLTAKLAESVIDQLGDEWDDFKSCYSNYMCASNGFSGFTYYTETVDFTKKHKKYLIKLCEYTADMVGDNKGAISFIASFNCLDLTEDQVAQGLYEPDSDYNTQVFNALAWFALETVASECERYLND